VTYEDGPVDFKQDDLTNWSPEAAKGSRLLLYLNSKLNSELASIRTSCHWIISPYGRPVSKLSVAYNVALVGKRDMDNGHVVLLEDLDKQSAVVA
jgi:hypothetical protein